MDASVREREPRPGLLILTILMGTALVPINSTMIAVDLPDIARSLAHSLAATVWVVSVYLIIMAVVQPIAGRAGDAHGHRRMFVGGLAVFLAGSLLAATSDTLVSLVAFRGLQALGAGIAGPNGTALLRRLLSDRLPRVLGTVGLVQGLGAASGPLLGALLIAQWGWNAIFWVNVPVLTLALVLALVVLPSDPAVSSRRMDIRGAVILAACLVALTGAIRAGRDAPVLLPLSALLAVWFVRDQRRGSDPLMDVSLFRHRAFRSANLGILLQNFLMYTVMLATPVLLTRQHRALTETGGLLLLFSLTMSAMSWAGGRLVGRTSRAALVGAGFGVSILAFAAVAWVLPLASPLADAAWMVVAGAGSGIGGVAIQATTLQSVPRSRAGMAAGIYATFRYLGSTLAAAVLAALAGAPATWLALLLVAALLGLGIAPGFRGFRPEAADAAVSGSRSSTAP